MSNITTLLLKDEYGQIYEPTNLIAKDGKTLYQYVKEGGYPGTEASFMQEFVKFVEQYPVGSIYISGKPESPAQYYGGEWEKIENKFLFAAISPENEKEPTAEAKYKNEFSGGVEQWKLETSEMPRHQHLLPVMNPEVGGSVSAFEVRMHNLGGTYWTKSVGGSQAHNNMPPYIAKNIWRRVK